MTFKTRALRVGLIGLFSAAAGFTQAQGSPAPGQPPGSAGADRAASRPDDKGRDAHGAAGGGPRSTTDSLRSSTDPQRKKPKEGGHTASKSKGQGASAPGAR